MNHSLSNTELQFVTDSEILFTKNRIISKVYDLFGAVAHNYQMQVDELSPFAIETAEAKISKGENYNGLPYVMLDYPRNFSKENSFSIRSFFWWGNFFSITIHLSGKYQQQFSEKIQQAISKKVFNGWFICTSDNQWEHHFERSNYTIITDINIADIATLPFIKIAKKIPLKEWDKVYEFYTKNCELLLEILRN